MKHVTLLCVAAERERTLDALREMGVMHLNLAPAEAESERLRTAQTDLAALRQVQGLLRDARAGKPVSPAVATAQLTSEQKRAVADLFKQTLPDTIDGDIAARVNAVQTLAVSRQALVDTAARLAREIARYRPFGDFDAALPRRLAAEGVPVRLFRRPANAPFTPPDGAMVETLEEDKDFIYGVMIGPGDLDSACETLELPDLSVSAMQGWLDQALARAARITELFKHAADHHAETFENEAARLTGESEFAAALAAMQAREAVAWITGWAPAESERALRDTAAERAWGLLLRDPSDDELPPTLLRPPKLFRSMQALFAGLGVAPAYREADVSVPFFAFFSVFFAMLVGDGGYGILILLLTLWLGYKYRFLRAAASPVILMTVFSAATIIWGALSNTWFGFHPAAFANPVSAWFNQPGGKGDSNLMLVCFTLGVAHLSIARLWNAIELFPDTKALAQIGWVGVIWFMYFVAGSVVGVLQMPVFMKPLFGVSLLLIALFMLKKSELKTNGADLGMLPLNIISCLGDIISYVRLFAVGLASVKVAENFNEMSLNLDLPLVVKIPCVLLILLLGHGLNFAMAGLAVLVHAVRLNTLEFSNHKGVSWSGFAFKPFRKL
jgi:V/A-type H+-transporting ATPase subunit I